MRFSSKLHFNFVIKSLRQIFCRKPAEKGEKWKDISTYSEGPKMKTKITFLDRYVADTLSAEKSKMSGRWYGLGLQDAFLYK